MSYLLISDSLVRGRALDNFLRDLGLQVSCISRPEDQMPDGNFDTVIVQFNRYCPEDRLEEVLAAELDLVKSKLDPAIPVLVTLPGALRNNRELTIRLANKCLQFGATDYIMLSDQDGSFSEELMIRLRICMEKARFSEKHESLKKESKALEYGAIVAICALAECRDQETGKHILRVSRLAKLIADHLPDILEDEASSWPAFPALLEQAAPLHDIGKVAIRDNILLNKKNWAGTSI